MLKNVDSTHIHVTCKFARRYGKDCKSEGHVNLNLRIRPINCIAPAIDDFRNDGRRRTYKWVFAYISRHNGTFNCLSIHIVSSVELRFAAGRLGKLYRRLWCLMSKAMDNIFKDFDFQSQNRKKIPVLYFKLRR